jgi:hypothetical protein
MSVMAYKATTSPLGNTAITSFDTDSFHIGIDNRCSACISNDRNDFIGPLKKVSRKVKGFGGATISNVYIGTLAWRIADDAGKVSTLTIPNSYYIPEGGV